MNVEVHQQAQAKIQWAEQRISELEIAIGDIFRGMETSPIASRQDPDREIVTYYVKELPVVPTSIALLAGDVLHNLRAALDYVAFGLLPPAERPKARNCKFPIASSAKDFPALVGRLIPGLSDFAMEALYRLRPYKGGNEYFWHLHQLNNVDKHRLLLTFGFMCVGRSLTPSERVAAEASVRQFPDKSYVVRRRPDDVPLVLSAGDELLTIPNDQAPVGFRFDVALREEGIPPGMPLALHLRLMRVEVGFAVESLYYFTR